MKKNVWILNHYAGEMYFNNGGRHYSFAKYLKRNGYTPIVFCSNAKHGEKAKFIDSNALYVERLAEEIDVPFVFIRSRLYDGNGRERILNMMDYFFNVQRTALNYLTKGKKPDVIYASSVHPLTLVAGIILSKIFHTKCICEIRDLWPESIVVYSNSFSRDNILIKLLYYAEKVIYKKSDALIFTMEGANQYIVNQGWEKDISSKKVHYINNGVDFEEYKKNVSNNKIVDVDLNNNKQFNVVYTGSIRKANRIDCLIDAAKLIKAEDIKILIWGSGSELETLKNKVIDEHVENVVFKGRVDKSFVPYILCKSNVNFIDIFDKNISKYGISSNKLFECLAAKKPLLINEMEDFNPIRNCECAIEYKISPQGIADAIDIIHDLTAEEYEKYCGNSEKISHKFSYENLAKELISVIEGV